MLGCVRVCEGCAKGVRGPGVCEGCLCGSVRKCKGCMYKRVHSVRHLQGAVQKYMIVISSKQAAL